MIKVKMEGRNEWNERQVKGRMERRKEAWKNSGVQSEKGNIGINMEGC